MKKAKLIPIWMSGLLALTGCITGRAKLNVQVAAPPNPASGKAVKIVRVSDKRQFERKPRKPSMPSLKDGDINNKAVTSRAIARKRIWFGVAMGDIVLPEGRTVEQVVTASITRAFREADYRVVGQGDSTYADAVPIEVDIDQLWAWVTPMFIAEQLQFQSDLTIKGDIPGFKEGLPVRGHCLKISRTARGRAWLRTIHCGLEDLVRNIKSRLKSD